MSTKRNAVADLQRELLQAAVKDQNNRLRFVKSSAETLATTYAALISLQRKNYEMVRTHAERLLTIQPDSQAALEGLTAASFAKIGRAHV